MIIGEVFNTITLKEINGNISGDVPTFLNDCLVGSIIHIL